MDDLFTEATQAADVSKKPAYDDIWEALRIVVQHLGETPHNWPSQDLYRAYGRAHELLYPEEYEFRERFMASAKRGT